MLSEDWSRQRRRLRLKNMENKPLKAAVKPPRDNTKPVTGRYRSVQRSSANRIRLMALVRLFRLSPNDIAIATGVSRPYVARLLSPNDEFVACVLALPQITLKYNVGFE